MLKATGVRYEPGWPAPIVLLKASGAQAKRVVDRALSLGIEVREEEILGQALYLLPEGSFIPEEYFQIMAGILSSVYTMKK